jgi:hypothetical protein
MGCEACSCFNAGGRLGNLRDSRPSSAQPSGEARSHEGDLSSRDLPSKPHQQGFKRLRRHGVPLHDALFLKIGFCGLL